MKLWLDWKVNKCKRLAMTLLETLVALFILSIVVATLLWALMNSSFLSNQLQSDRDVCVQVETLLFIDDPVEDTGELDHDWQWIRHVSEIPDHNNLIKVELILKNNEKSYCFYTVRDY